MIPLKRFGYTNAIFIFVTFFEFAAAQNDQALRIVTKLQPPPPPIPTTKYQYISTTKDEMLSNTKPSFTNAEGICARGMWALYTEQNWGEGLEANTTVISILSREPVTCYPVPGGVLKRVQSLNALGSKGDITKPGITFFTQSFFLGGRWDTGSSTGVSYVSPPSVPPAAAPTTPSAMTLGSFGVTGSNNVQLCVDKGCTSNGGVCIDMTKSITQMFMVKNVQADRSADRPWPITIKAVKVLGDNEPCPDLPTIIAK